MIGFLGPAMTRWLNRDVRLRSDSSRPGMVSGFLLGFAFAFCWTPCIGPILATVLALAAASETIGRGVLLLAAYSPVSLSLRDAYLYPTRASRSPKNRSRTLSLHICGAPDLLAGRPAWTFLQNLR